jgi:hypothetical protein
MFAAKYRRVYKMRIWLDLICTPLLPRAPKRGARMKRLTLLPLCALLVGYAVAANTTTHEETIVRTAYARLAYAVQQATVADLALEANGRKIKPENAAKTVGQRMADAEVVITLSNFVVGDVRAVLDRKTSDLVTSPHDERLELGLIESMGYGGAQWNDLRLEWIPAPAMTPQAEALTLREGLLHKWPEKIPTLQKYASYTVTITYKGKSRGPYHAMFVFGHDSQGNETAMPLDPNTSNTGLGKALEQDLSPTVFTRTGFRTHPVVTSWLTESQMSDAVCSASKASGVSRGDICCDLVKMKCGPSSSSVANDLSQPILKP